MTKLEDAYKTIDKVGEFGWNINEEEVLKSLDKFEKELIKDEVVPFINQDIAPKLNPIRRNFVLVLEYNPDEQIKVALSRKTKISDIADAELISPIIAPAEYVVIPTEPDELNGQTKPNPNPPKQPKKPTKGLKVTFPGDGLEIWLSTAIETYIATIKHIGYERVANVGIKHAGYNILSRKQRPTEPRRRWQTERDGWYIYTNIGNNDKIRDLKQISDYYNLGLVIEEIKPKKYFDF
ncbi:MAG: hypothetical protein LUC88_02850 [Prevotella sp.]|nr:hypothetical protein [Prevotella sp.]